MRISFPRAQLEDDQVDHMSKRGDLFLELALPIALKMMTIFEQPRFPDVSFYAVMFGAAILARLAQK
jgi:hypothetical protein